MGHWLGATVARWDGRVTRTLESDECPHVVVPHGVSHSHNHNNERIGNIREW